MWIHYVTQFFVFNLSFTILADGIFATILDLFIYLYLFVVLMSI